MKKIMLLKRELNRLSPQFSQANLLIKNLGLACVAMTLLILLLSAPVGAQTQSLGQIKSKLIADLNEVKLRNTKRLDYIKATLKNELVKSESLSIAGSPTALLDNKVTQFNQSIESLLARKNELLVRQQFFDRLIFIIENEYRGHDLKAFLTKSILSKAIVDSISNEGADPKQVQFYAHLATALREIPEPRENLIFFIEAYVNYSSLLNPKPPHQYLQVKSYSNQYTDEAPAKQKKQIDKIQESEQDKLLEDKPPAPQAPISDQEPTELQK